MGEELIIQYCPHFKQANLSVILKHCLVSKMEGQHNFSWKCVLSVSPSTLRLQKTLSNWTFYFYYTERFDNFQRNLWWFTRMRNSLIRKKPMGLFWSPYFSPIFSGTLKNILRENYTAGYSKVRSFNLRCSDVRTMLQVNVIQRYGTKIWSISFWKSIKYILLIRKIYRTEICYQDMFQGSLSTPPADVHNQSCPAGRMDSAGTGRVTI